MSFPHVHVLLREESGKNQVGHDGLSCASAVDAFLSSCCGVTGVKLCSFAHSGATCTLGDSGLFSQLL